jgi:hypothetical protein
VVMVVVVVVCVCVWGGGGGTRAPSTRACTLRRSTTYVWGPSTCVHAARAAHDMGVRPTLLRVVGYKLTCSSTCHLR